MSRQFSFRLSALTVSLVGLCGHQISLTSNVNGTLSSVGNGKSIIKNSDMYYYLRQ